MFDSIKRALGFGHKEYTDFEENSEALSLTDPASDQIPAAAMPDIDLDCAGELLDAILGVINANLPPLVSESIDSDRQRVKLTQLLGPALVAFTEKMKEEAANTLSSDREKMQTELDELRSQKKDFASKRDAQKANLLSEQRQRRALTDRNRDLEAKIDELQSEIEQHKLTVASLMNKIRVSEVSDSDVEDTKSFYESQLKDLKSKVETLESTNQEQASKIQTLETTNQEQATKIQTLEAENLELSDKIAELEVPQALEAALEQRKEIVESSNPPAQKPKRQKKPRRKPETAVKTAAEEELDELEMVNFLLPGGVPAGHQPAEPNPDFGYQPPKPSPEPNPDIQLTLF